MSATGEGLGAGREQKRTHRAGEQEACRTTLAIDDALDEGEHLGRAVKLVDRHETGGLERGADVLAKELEHAVIVEVENRGVPAPGDSAKQGRLPRSPRPFEQDRWLFVEQSVHERFGPPLNVPGHLNHRPRLSQLEETSQY